MKVRDIIQYLNQKYPKSQAVSWDNPGLQVGNPDRETKKVFVALEVTNETLDACIRSGSDLLITHHPLLMSGIKSITTESLSGSKILKMAEHKISHFAIHTNYDVTTMAELAIRKLQLSEVTVLEETGTDENGTVIGIGCTGVLPEKMTGRECCQFVKNAFGLEGVRLFGDPDKIVKKVAVCPGSGKGMASFALQQKADLLITGDIGHHDGLDAVDEGLLMMDAGHYGVEHVFIAEMAEDLRKQYPELEVEEAVIHHPFSFY